MSSSISGKFKFPSQEAITSYLEQHPVVGITNCPFLTEMKIIAAVAKVFANSLRTPIEVQLSVGMAVGGLDEELEMSDSHLGVIIMSLTAALEACAKGEKFG